MSGTDYRDGPGAAADVTREDATVVVLGDAMLDVWKWGRCERLCREAPVPVVDIERSSSVAGGAGNTAANVAALGADTRLLALTGDDAPATALAEVLARSGVDTGRILRAPDRATPVKTRIVADEQILVRFDDVSTGHARLHEVTEMLDRLDDAIIGAEALIVCDYGGPLGDTLREGLLQRREHLPLLIVDTHHPGRWRELHPDIVTPNAGEAAEVLGLAAAAGAHPEQRAELFDRHREALFDAIGTRTAVVTLDRDGSVLLDGDRPAHRTWAHPVRESQSAGGGDTFVAALTLAVLAGMPLTGAVEVAQAAADVVVHRSGTSVCTREQLRARIDRSGGAVLEPGQLIEAVRGHRAAGERIVFTNGCFDVVHAGHIAYLNEAKRLGDVLVVAVNSDDSVRRLKGPDRPVNPDHDRCAVLAALSCVDHVTVFDEDTPERLLRATEPDLYVKGGDYRPEMLPETPIVAEYGGEVRVLGYLADHSTSAMIERIRARSATGGG